MEELSKVANKRVIHIKGIDCANCAAKIQRKVEKLPGVNNAVMDFVSGRLTIDIDNSHDDGQILEWAIATAHKVEDGLSITLEKEEKKSSNLEADSASFFEENKIIIIRLSVALVLFFAALMINLPSSIKLGFYLLSYLISGGDVLLKAAKNTLKGNMFDEYFLMSVATLGAYGIRSYPEATAVMIFYQVGELIQGAAVDKSRNSIKALMKIRPDYANRIENGEIIRMDPEDIRVGEEIVVQPGERIPLDGEIISGTSFVDTSALTGESVPKAVGKGDKVLSGFVNKNGLINILVSKIYGESAIARVLELVENAAAKKAETERFITRFARYYTPAVVFLAVAIAFFPPLIYGEGFSQWIYKALVFLVISCPCALVLSVPLGFFGGIGAASKNGILIKGGNYLESMSKIAVVVFDKTGTLTKGDFEVKKVTANSQFTESDVLKYAYISEKYSQHPIALSIKSAYKEELLNINEESYQEIAGKGIMCEYENKSVIVGKSSFLVENAISVIENDSPNTLVYVGFDKEFVGVIEIADTLKDGISDVVAGLKKYGVKKTVMLTGDNKGIAMAIGKNIGIDEIYGELLPHEKVEKLEEIQIKEGRVLFVGDGINDAPVLARADIGVAMGGLGRDAAIEAADIVIMNDDPRKLIVAMDIARLTRKIVWQNLAFTFGIKILVLFLGAGGLATMWEAVFADVGVAVLAVLNAMRILKYKGHK